MTLSEDLSNRRKQWGWTQQQVAHEAGISLASLQNIEAGKANPSVKTLQRLLAVLGLNLELKELPADWERLAFLGAPLRTDRDVRLLQPQKEELIHQLKLACREIVTQKNIEEREREAVQALLVALKTHYPAFYRRHFESSQFVKRCLPRRITGRLIKLQRLAKTRLGDYL